MNFEYIRCNVYIIQGTTFNIVSLSTVCLSINVNCYHHMHWVTAASLQIFFFRIHSPLVRRQIFPPPEIFLEHLLQAFCGVDAPASEEVLFALIKTKCLQILFYFMSSKHIQRIRLLGNHLNSPWVKYCLNIRHHEITP